MRKISIIIGLILVLAFTAFAADMQSPYANWSQFKPGTYVKFKISANTAGTQSTTYMTYTLKEIKSDTVVLEVKTTVETMGMKVDGGTTTMEVGKNSSMPSQFGQAANVNVQNMSDGSSANVKTLGEEKVTIGGKTFTAQKVKVVSKQSGMESIVESWVSRDFPNFNVKMIATSKQMGMTSKVKMEAVDVKIVK